MFLEEFFRYGETEALDCLKGFKGSGWAVYTPVKGSTGVIMGSAAIVAGTGAMVVNMAMGTREIGEAGVYAARKRKDRSQTSDSESEVPIATVVDGPADTKFEAERKEAIEGANQKPTSRIEKGDD